MSSFRSAVLIAAAVAVAACAKDTTSPKTASNVTATDALLPIETADPSLGAMAGQPSLPGVLLDESAIGMPAMGRAPNGCAYDADKGRWYCQATTENGLTVVRSFAFFDAAGKPQQTPNKDTRSANTQLTVNGTVTRDKGSATIQRSSDVTQSGLNTSKLTTNGSESGTTSRTLTTDKGTMSATEKFSSASKDVAITLPRAKGQYPLSGTITHSADVTATLTNPTTTITHHHVTSETVTFNGTATVPVVIVRDGVTKTCSRDLGTGKTTCS